VTRMLKIGTGIIMGYSEIVFCGAPVIVYLQCICVGGGVRGGGGG
jgi:hypothetical protein